MLKKYKFMSNMGLAFDEERALKKLSKLASEGWILDKLTLWRGYRLIKSEPREVVYSLDYKHLDEGDKEEYIEMFEASGWELRCSYYDMHFFTAPPGTTPIYTDKESHLHKYKTQRIQSFRWSIISLIISIIAYIVAKVSLPYLDLESIKLGIYMIVGMIYGITGSLFMVTIAFYWRERRILSLHSKRIN